MPTYEETLSALQANADEEYRRFHGRLLKNENIRVIGVRMPVLRKLAKAWKGEFDTLKTFPDEYYEVTFLKCAAGALLPFDKFIREVDGLVSLLDNWATCDCFAPSCIQKHREEFLPYIEKYFADGREFVRRYALVTLLHFYVEEQYLDTIFSYLRRCRDEEYYAMMAAAWLLAEVLVKFYERSEAFLKETNLDGTVRRKGIQKACESFRLTRKQKENLKAYKSPPIFAKGLTE